MMSCTDLHIGSIVWEQLISFISMCFILEAYIGLGMQYGSMFCSVEKSMYGCIVYVQNIS